GDLWSPVPSDFRTYNILSVLRGDVGVLFSAREKTGDHRSPLHSCAVSDVRMMPVPTFLRCFGCALLRSAI
ncbi:MAG: hypothetical protein IJO91_08240, partial [Oscillospiraceae bacterium]|nr:hypothetical protein [Oscillospiraceae bacterium]